MKDQIFFSLVIWLHELFPIFLGLVAVVASPRWTKEGNRAIGATEP